VATEKKVSRRDRQLAAFTHMEQYIDTFLRRWRTPTRSLDTLTEALEEVARERLLLQAERDSDVPTLRKNRK